MPENERKYFVEMKSIDLTYERDMKVNLKQINYYLY